MIPESVLHIFPGAPQEFLHSAMSKPQHTKKPKKSS
jgi:hypothetical protein